MAKTQKYGIKFPFGVVSEGKTLLDLNLTKAEQIKSQLMHVLFTPKGQMLRTPDFGTDLLQYIFNPNDSQTWGDVKFELKECVKQWIPDCNLEDIEIYETNEGRGLVAAMKYSVTESNGASTTYELITNL